MTPIEIFEYKKNWQRNHHYSVRLHSDLQSKGKDWCKVQLFSNQWDVVEYTNVYEDTFLFEHRIDKNCFIAAMPKKFVNQEPVGK